MKRTGEKKKKEKKPFFLCGSGRFESQHWLLLTRLAMATPLFMQRSTCDVAIDLCLRRIYHIFLCAANMPRLVNRDGYRL